MSKVVRGPALNYAMHQAQQMEEMTHLWKIRKQLLD